MAAKKTPKTGKGLQFSHCTPFPLVQKLEDRNSENTIPDEPSHTPETFESDKMGEAEALERIALYNSQIKELYGRTMMGDELATAVLAEYASVAIQALEQIARSTPERLHQMSMNHIRWPSFIGIKEFHTERNRELIKRLRLGETSPFRHKWDPKSPATFTAYSLLFWLDENQTALELPPLSKASFEHWFKTGWEGFAESLGGRPETYPYLRHSYEQAAARKVAGLQEKRNLETVIRELMKKAVKQGFKSVTKNYLS